MNNYAVKAYFQDLCTVQYDAYMELKRLKNTEDELEEGSERQLKWAKHLHDVAFWNNRLNMAEKDVIDLVFQIHTAGEKVMITTDEEVLALINFYSNFNLEKNRIVDENEYYCNSEIGRKFKKAYLEKDHSKILELYMDTFGRDIL